VKEGDQQVIADAVRIGNYQKNEVPQSAEEFAQRLLHTVYMGTENRFVLTKRLGPCVHSFPDCFHLAFNSLVSKIK